MPMTLAGRCSDLSFCLEEIEAGLDCSLRTRWMHRPMQTIHNPSIPIVMAQQHGWLLHGPSHGLISLRRFLDEGCSRHCWDYHKDTKILAQFLRRTCNSLSSPSGRAREWLALFDVLLSFVDCTGNRTSNGRRWGWTWRTEAWSRTVS